MLKTKPKNVCAWHQTPLFEFGLVLFDKNIIHSTAIDYEIRVCLEIKCALNFCRVKMLKKCTFVLEIKTQSRFIWIGVGKWSRCAQFRCHLFFSEHLITIHYFFCSGSKFYHHFINTWANKLIVSAKTSSDVIELWFKN